MSDEIIVDEILTDDRGHRFRLTMTRMPAEKPAAAIEPTAGSEGEQQSALQIAPTAEAPQAMQAPIWLPGGIQANQSLAREAA